VGDNNLYDIRYDDGDNEQAVSPDCIRSTQASKLSTAQIQIRDKCKALGAFACSNETDMRQKVFNSEHEYLKRRLAIGGGAGGGGGGNSGGGSEEGRN
jgi:hypothetical protein